MNLRVVGTLLARQGYEVISAGSGEEALQRYVESPPDLVLLDMMMPGMDGFDVLAALNECGTLQVPVVFVTAAHDRDLLLRGRHMLPRLRETVQRAMKLGVKIVTGADTSYGPASVTRISHEVAAFVEMGMPPLQALQAATSGAAEMLSLSSRVGAIETGLEADLLVVERNPLQQVSTLDDPLLVVSNGRVVVNRLSFARQAAGTSGGREER